MGRTLLAVIAGLLLAWLAISLFEFASIRLSPPPPGLDPNDPAALAQIVAAASPMSLALVVAGWLMGALGGGLVAASIARRHRLAAALTVGAMVLLGVIAMIMMVPHPGWMAIVGVLLPLPAAWLGAKLAPWRVDAPR